MSQNYKFDPQLDLKLERIVDVSPEKIYRAWTDPVGLKNWFCPKPWMVTHCEMDLRPGGRFITVMRSPEGQEFPNGGCFLELVPGKKLVWTDGLLEDYRPSPTAFMTAMLLLEPSGSGTKYTAVAYHKTAEDRQKHEEMGFVQGWGIVLDQLTAYIKSL